MEWIYDEGLSGLPSPRFGHSMNLVDKNKLVLFGGQNGENFFNDVHIFYLESMSWIKAAIKGSVP